ncbi:MAG: F-type H+-transporting ATPase subunit epsilon [Pirellulaceae bacterium]|jgi:F-type H+-transporting ATPase subunit epsilon
MAGITCVVVTPEETALETKCDFVIVPLYDGEKGIAPNHSPMIGRLGYGELRIKNGNSVTRYYVDGGFVQVANNTVSVLTNHAVLASEVDANAAKALLQAAAKLSVSTDEQYEVRERQIAQARAQLRASSNG